MRVSAKADYAIRALCEIGQCGDPDGRVVSADAVAAAAGIPRAFLLGILAELRRGGIVASQRGAAGGWVLARDAGTITLAEIIRAVDGPLASVHGQRPETLDYGLALAALQRVWIAVRASLREVLETVTLADLLAGSLPAEIDARARDAETWRPH